MNTFRGRIPSLVTRSCLISSGLTSVKVVATGGKCEDNCLWFPVLRCVRLQLGTLSACYFISGSLTCNPVVLTEEDMERFDDQTLETGAQVLHLATSWNDSYNEFIQKRGKQHYKYHEVLNKFSIIIIIIIIGTLQMFQLMLKALPLPDLRCKYPGGWASLKIDEWNVSFCLLHSSLTETEFYQ